LEVLEKIRTIQTEMPGAMSSDRHAIALRLRSVQARLRGGGEGRTLRQELITLEGKLLKSIRRKSEREKNRPQVRFPEELPISARKEEIIRAIRENQVVIISGETGSGKSTQIPKMCLEAGRGIDGKIGCTQPRRIAASAIARRIAEELGEEIGKSVGYKIRFTDRTHPDAYIKVVTDGLLLAETQKDRALHEYDTLIVDEAHERSLNIDFLLGMLKTLLHRRKDLKLIITSATIDTKKFSEAFDGAPILEVSGRTYPVEVEYMPLDPDLEEAGEVTYVDMAIQAVERLQRNRMWGDILIFMPTEQDILETCERLEGRQSEATTVLPLFARLQGSLQARVFSPVPGRKIVVATNVAETSLTIPGIKYVIDSGLARILRYLPRTRTTSLPVSPVSRSNSDQRKGRCGRMEEGLCIRLYSEEDYLSRPLYTPPEILRSNLAEVILRMVSLQLGEVSTFPFIDRPNPKSVKDGFDLLGELGAIEMEGSRYTLTEKGKIMARMPLDPRISRMMIEARREGCLHEVAVIASALSIQDPRERPSDQRGQADQMHASFRDPDSDFISLLNIWNRYHRTWDSLKTQNQMRKFCKQHFLSFGRMREWRLIHEQITAILSEHRMEAEKPASDATQALYPGIHRSVLSGYLSNIAMKKEKNLYQAARGREAMIHPGSSLFKKPPEWIVAAEMVKTSRLFARNAAKIDPLWLEGLGGELCRSSYFEPHWEKKRGEVRAFEQVSLYGLVIIPKRSVSFGKIDPAVAHEIFVQSALVEGEVNKPLPFLLHNRELIDKIEKMEDKLRRRDILVGEGDLADFYSRRLEGVSDLPSLLRRIKEKGGDDFLRMREEDLLLNPPDGEALSRFPDQVALGRIPFPCAYRFAPGQEDDGVTVKIPSGLAPQVKGEQLEWLVPGLFREKVTLLLKGLPKRFRRPLVPVTQTVEVILSEMKREDEPLTTALGRFIHQRFGVDIPASEWPDEDLPAHLKMRVAITDPGGREIESGRDLKILKTHAPNPPSGSEELKVWKEARMRWEKSGLTSWDFGPLPENISLEAHLMAYPALEPGEGGVNLRLLHNREEAREVHKKGVEALFSLHFSKDLKFLKRVLLLPRETGAAAVYFGGAKAVESAMLKSHIQRLFRLNLRSPEDFRAHGEEAKRRMLTDASKLLDQTVLVLEAYHQTRSALLSLEKGNTSNPAAPTLCSEIRTDLERLVPGDFLDRYADDRISQLPRYLKAMQIRAERGINDFEKDRRKAARLQTFVASLEKVRRDRKEASREREEVIETFGWMIEEYKISLFAQELKTLFPVSEKRLEKVLKEIQRMV
jgi:ATP-dependent helicase HrpA